MGVYSIMLPDEHLLKSIQSYSEIVILGCGGCSNDSLAYVNCASQKARFEAQNQQYRTEPEAVLSEAKRLKSVFEKYNKNVQIAIGMHLCSSCTGDKPEDWLKICQDAEAVLTLSCVAGTVGAKALINKGIKVIPGMKTIGVLYSHHILDPVSGLITLDKEKSVYVTTFN
jgi:hypothetical protein